MDDFVSSITVRVVSLIIALVVLLFAYIIDKEYRPKDRKTFVWGFYLSLMQYVNGIVLMIWLFGMIAESYYPKMSDYLLAVIIITPIIIIATLNIMRKKIGAILITIISLNPVIWYINFVYYKKRWNELTKIKIPFIKYLRITKTINPPFVFSGVWINEKYSIEISGKKVVIFDNNKGIIDLSTIIDSKLNGPVYTIEYMDKENNSNNTICFTKINSEEILFVLYKGNLVVAINETLKYKK